MMRNRKNSITQKKAFIKILVFTGFILIVFTSFGLGKEIVRRQKINQEIEDAKGDIESLEKKNKELSQLIEYLQTDSFKEIQARQNLGYQKAEETAVSIESNDRSYDQESEASYDQASDNNISNFRRWWNYFFAYKAD